MHKGIKYCVSVNRKLSPFLQCSTGVRQFKTLCPILFLIYLNDLGEHLRFDRVNGIKLVFILVKLFFCFLKFLYFYMRTVSNGTVKHRN